MHLTRTIATAAILTSGIAVLNGCQSRNSTDSDSAATQPRLSDMRLAEAEAYAEGAYLIPPSVARSIGYRIGWQRSPSADPITDFFARGDSVLAMDSDNFLTRLRMSDGVRLWRVPVAAPVEEVFGMEYAPAINRVFVVTGSALFELDADNGNLISKQQLQKIAATPPVLYGQFILYGSRNGQLVWHSFLAQNEWKSYQIAPSIVVQPVADPPYVVCVGKDGRVMVLHAGAVSQMWSTRLLDDVVASPVTGAGAVFVSSLDQHLRAYDIQSGRVIWSKLTESPLNTSPVLIGDRVYQWIPGRGVAAFEALPFDAPGGVEVWHARGVEGQVVTQRNHDLICWNQATRTVTVVEGRTGAVIESHHLPKVAALYSTSVVEGELFGLAANGETIRITPRTAAN